MFLVLDKYRILHILMALVFSVLVVMVAVQKSVETMGENKQLPIYSVQTDQKKVAITFDCAWGDEDIPEIIQGLEDNDCLATFFIVGQWAEKYPESVKKLVDAGHEIGNHSYSHAHFKKLKSEQIMEEINRGNQAISAITGIEPILFRPPYGEYNRETITTARAMNMNTIQWDVDSLDYKNTTYEQMMSRINAKIKNGSIILFHTGTKTTKSVLPQILSKLKSDGFSFVTVGDLILKDNYTLDHEGRQIPAEQ